MKTTTIIWWLLAATAYGFIAYKTYRQVRGGGPLTKTDKAVMPIVAALWPVAFLLILLLELFGRRRK